MMVGGVESEGVFIVILCSIYSCTGTDGVFAEPRDNVGLGGLGDRNHRLFLRWRRYLTTLKATVDVLAIFGGLCGQIIVSGPKALMLILKLRTYYCCDLQVFHVTHVVCRGLCS